MYLRSIRLVNTGPIEDLRLDLPFSHSAPLPLILVGRNGSGKSTALSFAVNALVAMKQRVYDDAEIEKGKVYRIRSPLGIRNDANHFFAKVLFDHGVALTEWQLNDSKQTFANPATLQSLDPVTWNAIPQNETNLFSLVLGSISQNHDLKKVVDENCALYFSADRFEPPDWLNVESLSSDLRLPETTRFSNKSGRRIFARNRLRPTLEWFHSVIFDMLVAERSAKGTAHAVFDAVQSVLKAILCDRDDFQFQLGIGNRNSRILNATIRHQGELIRLVKDLMSLSAGESALFCLFASIIHDADISGQKFSNISEIKGLVLVDEIDMHLHVNLQYKVLPKLIHLFPKVQFVITAHAPMIVLGLQNEFGADGFEVRELPSGSKIGAESYSEFQGAFEAYADTQHFRDVFARDISKSAQPILMVEGKSDATLISTAWAKINPGVAMPFEIVPCGVEADPSSRSGGAEQLRRCMEFLAVVSDRRIVAVFDFDRIGYEQFKGLTSKAFAPATNLNHRVHLTKDMHAILLPIPDARKTFVNYKNSIHSFLSIEHYFSDEILANHGFSQDPIVTGSSVYEISAPSKQKVDFSEKVAALDVREFSNFSKLFERIAACTANASA